MMMGSMPMSRHHTVVTKIAKLRGDSETIRSNFSRYLHQDEKMDPPFVPL